MQSVYKAGTKLDVRRILDLTSSSDYLPGEPAAKKAKTKKKSTDRLPDVTLKPKKFCLWPRDLVVACSGSDN